MQNHLLAPFIIKKKKKLYAAESLIKLFFFLSFFFFLFLFWYLCFCSFYMKFSAKEGLSLDYIWRQPLAVTASIKQCGYQAPPHPKLSALILNLERFFFSSLSTPCKCLDHFQLLYILLRWHFSMPLMSLLVTVHFVVLYKCCANSKPFLKFFALIRVP